MKQIHLTSEEYWEYLSLHNLSTKYRILALDCGIAGYIHYIIHDNTLIFEDYFYANEEMLQKHFAHKFAILHAEVYWKLALTNLSYMK